MDSNAEESQKGKEKDKSKAAKQLHSVQKAFGSIGMPTWKEIIIFKIVTRTSLEITHITKRSTSQCSLFKEYIV